MNATLLQVVKEKVMEDKLEGLDDARMLTAKGNITIMRKLVKDWHLGPDKAYDNSTGNSRFWNSIAKKWYISEEKARRRNCMNCEYGKTSPEFLEAMEHIPYNRFDKDGGQRVWCEKYDFICHATRVCSAGDWDD